jgi:hypothetical protein
MALGVVMVHSNDFVLEQGASILINGDYQNEIY